MADLKLYLPKLIHLEGGFVENKNDPGGPTKYGITLDTWKQIGYDKDQDGDIDRDDIRLLNEDDFKIVALKDWNSCQADKINNQSIAELFVDFHYNSGTVAIKTLQMLLNIDTDGIVGINTLKAINKTNQEDLFYSLLGSRIGFVYGLCIMNKTNFIFLIGWLNRIRSFYFQK